MRKAVFTPTKLLVATPPNFFIKVTSEMGIESGMEPFKFGGRTLEVWTHTGTVLSTSSHSKTNVASYGGGGYVGRNGGSVSAPTIVSSTTTEHEIWLRRDNGEEVAIQVANVDVPVREGQRVTVIAAKRPKTRDGFWVSLVNHSANRHWRLCTNIEASRVGKLGAYPLVRWYDFVMAFVICVLSLPVAARFLTPPDDGHGNKGIAWTGLLILFGVPLLYLVLRSCLRILRRNRVFAALDVWAERNAQLALSSERASVARSGLTERVA